MKRPDKRIVEFINKHHVLTLATCKDNIPWCSNCFYVFLEEEALLVFTSSMETRHAKEALANRCVSGSIVLETSIVGKIRGVQLSGTMEMIAGDLLDRAKKAYLKRFPFAALMDTTLWVFRIEHIKMTDNRLGFGKKRIWERGAQRRECV